MSQDWEPHLQQGGLSSTALNMGQNGSGGLGMIYPRGENVRPVYNLPQGTPPIQGVQRPVGNLNVQYVQYRSPPCFNTQMMEVRPQYPSSCPSRGRIFIKPGKQGGQRYSCGQITQGSSNTFNTPTVGILPPPPIRMQNNQQSTAPYQQLHQREQMVFPATSVQPAPLSTSNGNIMCVTETGGHNSVYLHLVAVGARENAFQPASGVHFSHSEISFAVKCADQDKDIKEIRILINERHIRQIAYTPGRGTRKYLAFLLSDIRRSNLHKELQDHECSRYWDLILYVRFPSCAEKDVLSKLRGYYGSRFRYVASDEWKTMPDLSRNIAHVMRYARYLDRVTKQCQENVRSEFASQGCAPAQHASVSSRKVTNIYRDETQTDGSNGVAATDLHATQGASNVLHEVQAVEDKNNNFLGTDTSTSAIKPGDYSSDWDTSQVTQPEMVSSSINTTSCQSALEGTTPALTDSTAVSVSDNANFGKNYRTASEFFASFRGLDDGNDFPADFLEEKKPDVAEHMAKKHEEPLTLEDDDDETASEELKFKDGVSMTVNVARDNLLSGALMNGDMASFYIVHYIPHAMLPDDWPKKDKVLFANSDMFPMIKRKCSDKLFLECEEVTAETVKKVFATRKGATSTVLQKLLESELSVIPIFWENHWVLALLQMYPFEKDSVSGRFIIIDSKFDDAKNAYILKKMSLSTHECFSQALRLGLILIGKPPQLENFPCSLIVSKDEQ
ncbi:hypothetical protein GCK32_008647 [Trichostrongylus colubriformis]|uniref:Uncharacterized protein n=1 Tax=Trichostrongylus colubriformis TaxID=6319 RepID=A0AAN8GFC3_TRICO